MPLRSRAAGGRTVDILCEEPSTVPERYPSPNSPSLERRIQDFSFGSNVENYGAMLEAAGTKARRLSEEDVMRARFDSYASSSSSISHGSASGLSGFSFSSAATSLTGTSPADYERGTSSSGSWSNYSSDAFHSSPSLSVRTNSTDSVPNFEASRPLMTDHRSRSLCAIPQKRTQSNPEPDGRDENVRQRRAVEGLSGSYSSAEILSLNSQQHRDSSSDGLPGIRDLLGSPRNSYVRTTSPRPSTVVLAPNELGKTMPIPLPVPGPPRPSLLSARHNSLPVLPPNPAPRSVAHFTVPDYGRAQEAHIVPPAVTPSPPIFTMRPRGLSMASQDPYDDRNSSRHSSASSRTPSPTPKSRRSSTTRSDSLSSSAPNSSSNNPAVKPIKRKFPCTICGKHFTTSGHLSRHGRTHTGEKNYECPYKDCGSRFSRQDNCMQHYRTHMADESRRRKKKTPGTSTSTAGAGSTSAPAVVPVPMSTGPGSVTIAAAKSARTFKDSDALATLANVAIAVGGELDSNGRDI